MAARIPNSSFTTKSSWIGEIAMGAGDESAALLRAAVNALQFVGCRYYKLMRRNLRASEAVSKGVQR